MSLDVPGNRTISEDEGVSDAKKRRGPGASSRGVANLTAEQLAKKRANDREAQRAIRERTKNQIETLEARIRALTAQEPYQELQHVLRQKEVVEAENADIRKRLANVLAMIQPVLGQQPPNDSAAGQYSSPTRAFTSVHRPAPSPNANSSTPTSAPSPSPGNSSSWSVPIGPTLTEGGSFANSRAFHQQRYDLAHGLNMGPERLGLDFLLDGTQQTINKLPNNVNGVQNSPSFYHSSMKPESGSMQPQTHPSQRRSPGGTSSQMAYNTSSSIQDVPAYAAPIRNSAPTCPLDNILLDFLRERQQQAAEGVSTPRLVGPAYPSVSSLLNPAHSLNSHPLSKVFTDILGTFPDISTLPEKVAVLYIMFLIMRWQISPTEENYERLPDWMTPRPSQLFTPHPAWIDHCPWPRMRDKLVRDYRLLEYSFDNFFVPFTSTLSLNWPYEATDTLLSSGDSEELIINPVFERHLRRLDNWSLGPAFEKSFPGLLDTYRLKTETDRTA